MQKSSPAGAISQSAARTADYRHHTGEAMARTKKKSVAKVSRMKDGEMRAVKVYGTDILLVRLDGEFFALGAHCTHKGAR
jgi:archaeosine-15-forming tRNA-guanine transglycosylase